MRPSIRIDADEFRKKLERLGPEKRSGVERVVAASTINVHRHSVRSIQRGPATGTVYEKYLPRRTHQASSAGQAPMSDTGTLAGSIQYQLQGMSGVVGTSLNYGLYLEFGTSEIRPRPWLTPAIERERPVFRKALIKAMS